MLLIIHNLPNNIRYNEIKSLIHSKCGLSELILDNLVPDGNGKKVTVGVAEEGDAAILVRKINGIYLNGHQLYVEDARRKKASEQPYRSTTNLVHETLSQNSYQAPSQLSQSNQDNPMSLMMQAPMVPNFMNMGMNQMYYTPPVQNTPYLGYGGQAQQITNQSMSQFQQPVVQMDQHTYGAEENNTNFQSRWSSDPGFDNEQSSFVPQEEPGAQARGRSRDGHNRPDREYSARGHERRDLGNIKPSRRSQHSRSPPRGRDKHVEVWQRDSPAGTKYDRDQHKPFSGRSEGFPPHKFGPNSKPGYVDSRAPPARFPTNTRGQGSHNQGPSRAKKPRWEDTEAFQSRMYRQERPERMPPRNQQNRDNRPGDNWRARDTQAPPQKRGRQQHSDYEEPRTKKFAAQKPDDRNKPIQKPRNDMKTDLVNPTQKDKNIKIQNRTVTYRGQAASYLLKDMISNPKLEISNEMIPLLKTFLRERIDILMEGTSDVPREDIAKIFRMSFPKRADRGFLNKVKRANTSNAGGSVPINEENKAKVAHQGDAPGSEPNVAGSSSSKPNVTAMPKFVPKDKRPQPFVSAPEDPQAPPPTKRIPKYAEGNKKKHMESKKLTKLETTDPSIYTLDPKLDKILNEEIDFIVNMFVEEFANPKTEMDHHLKEHLNDEVIEELKWVFKLPTIKRLLDIKSNLLIRIFGHPKPPKRASLDAFLRPYGVVSLKKSVRKPLYVASCDSYANYDLLCRLGEAVIDDMTCSFKPMYVAGVPNKRKGMHRFQFGKPQKTQAFNPVQTTPAEVKVEKKENDAEIARNCVIKDVKKEADNKDSIELVEDSKANIDSIKPDTGSDGKIDSIKTDNVTSENDTKSSGNDIGLCKYDIDTKNNTESIKDSAKNEENIDEVNDKTDNGNAVLEENNLIADINEVIADMDDENDDDGDEDARHDVNFGEIDLDDLADVDVRDLEDDDLEDY